MTVLRDSLLFFSIAIIFSGGVSASRLEIPPGTEDDFGCKIESNDRYISFEFFDVFSRKDTAAKWNYSVGSAIEYAWLIYGDLPHEHNGQMFEGIDFGLRYFRTNEPVKKGPIDNLLSESELVLFRHSSEGFFLPIEMPAGSASYKREDGNLILILNKNKHTAFVFNALPATLNFWVFNPSGTYKTCLLKRDELR